MVDPRLFDFAITGVRKRYVDRAQRYALTPLTGARQKGKSIRQTDIIEDSERLIERWRARVDALRKEGWQRPVGKSLVYTLNCPPVGVTTNKKTRPCNQYAVCPFCWCRRYVEPTYVSLEFAYYDNEAGRPLPLDLIEVITVERLPEDEWPLHRLFDWIQHNRRVYLDENLPNHGAFQLFSIEPSDPRIRSRPPYWEFKHRVLAIVDPHQNTPTDEPEFEEQIRRVKRYPKISRKQLATAVGRVAVYPKQLMYGPKQKVAELLELKRTWGGAGSKGFRMSGLYGLLRNKSSRERDRPL